MLRVCQGGLQSPQTRPVSPKFTHGASCCGPTAKNFTGVAFLVIGVAATALATLSLLGYLNITSAIGSFSTTVAIATLIAGGTITVGTIVGLMFYNILRRDHSYEHIHHGDGLPGTDGRGAHMED
ncbi:MAG: hypothetical protein K1000chlam4_00256 [Chlamydiae bacterium]|nr:hypothetical protein [Chlamydiota bacterium]